MPPRLAACDPCRSAKVACDHGRPTCSGCREAARESKCTYRERPFKRRRKSSSPPEGTLSPASTDVPSDGTQTPSANYPNPGYLGSSSSMTIFNHLPPDDDGVRNVRGSLRAPVADMDVARGARLLKQAFKSLHIPSCKKLVEAWTATGINLSLAGSFMDQCTETANAILTSLVTATTEAKRTSRDLFNLSARPLTVEVNGTVENFVANFCHRNVRWETLGLFFTVVSRAAADYQSFEPLYSTSKGQRTFQSLALRFSDRCLDLALLLDNMNDLQLVLQYENFIAHSIVDGDQSYHSWRGLGDVISSLFALGRHEQVENDVSAPGFLINLRKAAFARAYSADKNLSIFLGRPPRMNRKYCQFHLPDGPETTQFQSRSPIAPSNGSARGRFDYAADTRWSAMCAMHKEEILELSRDVNPEERIRRVEIIQANAEAQWQSLPQHLRLDGPLKLRTGTPTERDLLVSTRLNHLHVKLLLQLAVVRRITEPEGPLITISMEMLQLVVQVVILRHNLVSSGTGLLWKVAHYGLPAAGIICLSLLRRSPMIADGPISTVQVFQDLSVLVAEVEAGALVGPEHPNYMLLSGAARTIKTILDRFVFRDTAAAGSVAPTLDDNDIPLAVTSDEADWMPWATQDLWDFEMDFWLGLSEHPSLAVPNGTVPDALPPDR